MKQSIHSTQVGSAPQSLSNRCRANGAIKLASSERCQAVLKIHKKPCTFGIQGRTVQHSSISIREFVVRRTVRTCTSTWARRVTYCTHLHEYVGSPSLKTLPHSCDGVSSPRRRSNSLSGSPAQRKTYKQQNNNCIVTPTHSVRLL